MIQPDAVDRAQRTLDGHVTRTPLVVAPSLCHDGMEVRLKLETTQPVGSFKIRGAINAVANLSDRQRARGVVCASTGNHGRAVAYAARMLGARASVCVSSLVPQNKIEAIRQLGGEVRVYGNSQDEAQRLVDRLVAEEKMTEIPPFDHADVIAGQGTIGLELLEDWPEVDSILVGLSGGGLLGGIALAAKAIKPGILVGNLMDELVLLSEAQIAAAMRYLFLSEALVTEGAGAVGVAPLIDEGLQAQLGTALGHRVAIVVSGKNVDMDDFLQVIDSRHPLLRVDPRG
jgi:threonine dehydratase